MLGPTGGRVTVFQCVLPQKGPGALESREDPNQRSSKDVQHLNPATDFYKSLSLEFSAQQIAVDLFLLAGTVDEIHATFCHFHHHRNFLFVHDGIENFVGTIILQGWVSSVVCPQI